MLNAITYRTGSERYNKTRNKMDGSGTALYAAMNPIEFENSYSRAATVFFMIVAALIAPIFMASGLKEEWSNNLLPGIGLLIYLVYWLAKAMHKISVLPTSDKIAFIYIPLCLLPVGCVVALAGASN